MRLVVRFRLSIGILATLACILAPSVSFASPREQETLMDPSMLFLDDSDIPRGYVRTPGADRQSSSPVINFALRQHSNGSALIQQIVYVAASESGADQAGGDFVNSLAEGYGVDFGEILTLGDKAVSGVGEDENGVTVTAVVFKRGALTGSVVWIDVEDSDLEADAVALAGKMDARFRALITR